MKLKKEVKLKKALGLFEATAYGVGIILGAGIYALIGHAAGIAGNAIWLSFVVAAIIASFTAFSYAELSGMFQKEAAEFVYVKEATRKKPLAFIIGWVAIVTGIVSVSTVALGFGGYFQAIFGTPQILNALALIAALSILNFWGIKESAKFNIVATAIEMLGLLIIIALGVSFFGNVNYLEVPGNAAPFSLDFFTSILAATAIIFFAYLGFEEMANMSEETKNAKKTIPKALLIALAVSTIIYILVSIAAVSAVPWNELSQSKAPLATVAEKAFGANAYFLLAVMALFATANTVLILLIVTSRMLYGMASESSLPKWLAKVHDGRKTPHIAIALSAIFAMLFTLLGKIGVVASITDFGVFVVFLAVNGAVVLLRYSKPNARRTFKTPINIGKFPLLSFLGALFCFLMLFQFIEVVHILGYDVPIIIFGLAVVVLGYPVYRMVNR